MNDDDTDAGGDFFFDLMKTLIAIFVFILFVLVFGTVVGGIVFMALVIYIPVLFVCMNGGCNFMQATRNYTRESECKAALVEQRTRLEEMATRVGKQ
jgi:hypothetical protein